MQNDISFILRVQLEVDKVLGNKNHISADDLDKLEYTEQVCVLCVHVFVCVYKTVYHSTSSEQTCMHTIPMVQYGNGR